MIKMIETAAYKSLWTEAQQWIRSNASEIAVQDLENEEMANKFVRVAARAYYSNAEDYSPNVDGPLRLHELHPTPELMILLANIKEADRHGYARAEIRRYEQAQQLAS
jgi:hypothetical protein